jgi:hypothetical protein
VENFECLGIARPTARAITINHVDLLPMAAPVEGTGPQHSGKKATKYRQTYNGYPSKEL